MKYPTFLDFVAKSSRTALLVVLVTALVALISLPFLFSARSQTRPRVTATGNSNTAGRPDEIVKVDVDLVTIDALVLDKKTARGVGDLQQQGYEDAYRLFIEPVVASGERVETI